MIRGICFNVRADHAGKNEYYIGFESYNTNCQSLGWISEADLKNLILNKNLDITNIKIDRNNINVISNVRNTGATYNPIQFKPNIRLVCLVKLGDKSGKILMHYVMNYDNTSERNWITTEKIKMFISSGKIQVLNMKLSKDGRLIRDDKNFLQKRNNGEI